MRLRRRLLVILTPLLTLAPAFPATAQGLVPVAAPPDGTITGTGAATIKRAPDVLRLEVQLSAEGKDLKEALAKLGQRRDACRKKLAALGAKDEAITFDPPRLDAADPRQQMEQMMRQRMARGPQAAAGPNAAGAAAPAAQRVVVTARAEWPLAAARTPEDLLVAAVDLQEKVKAADLGETKLASLEEQEAREERAGADPSEQGAAPGEPVFMYVARIPAADRAAAVADAFKKARASAADLAKAAGAELGALRQLQSQDVPDVEQYQQMMFGRYRSAMYQQAASGDPSEAVAPQPGPVTVRIQVSASFGVK